METNFFNQRFLITGGASGIGLATARLLKRRGAWVTLWDVNAAALGQAAAELGVATAVVDITCAEQVNAAMERAVAEMGELDGLVHCAGILKTGLFEDISADVHRRIVEVNLIGTLNVVHAALPHLKRTHGAMVLMGSTAAFYGSPEFASYATTKAGVLSLAQALRLELDGTGVYVGVCNPLFVDSPMLNAENRRARTFQRQGVTNTPEQVGQVILRAIERRTFLIFPTYQPRAVFWVSRYGSWFAHTFMKMNWK